MKDGFNDHQVREAMKNSSIVCSLAFVCVLLATENPAFGLPNNFICAAAEAVACSQDEPCVRGSAARVGLPLLWKVDLKKKTVLSIREGGEKRNPPGQKSGSPTPKFPQTKIKKNSKPTQIKAFCPTTRPRPSRPRRPHRRHGVLVPPGPGRLSDTPSSSDLNAGHAMKGMRDVVTDRQRCKVFLPP